MSTVTGPTLTLREAQAIIRKRYLRGERLGRQEGVAVDDAIERAARELAKREVCLRWAYEQLRQWWRNVPRDRSDPASAIAELDREEAAVLGARLSAADREAG